MGSYVSDVLGQYHNKLVNLDQKCQYILLNGHLWEEVWIVTVMGQYKAEKRCSHGLSC